MPSEPVRQAVETRYGYDLWASTYDATPNPIVTVDDEVLSALIGDVSGQVVVDAGCGTGRHTVRLAASAARVIAIDYSEAMLEQLRRKVGGGHVECIAHDLRTPLPIGSQQADGVVCALVGEHIENLVELYRELHRVLRVGGWLVFSVYHPYLALSGKQANFTDEHACIEYRLGALKHQISDYFTAMSDAGFTVELMHEHVVDDEMISKHSMLMSYRGQPVLLTMRGHAGIGQATHVDLHGR